MFPDRTDPGSVRGRREPRDAEEIEINPVLVGPDGKGSYAVDCICTLNH